MKQESNVFSWIYNREDKSNKRGILTLCEALHVNQVIPGVKICPNPVATLVSSKGVGRRGVMISGFHCRQYWRKPPNNAENWSEVCARKHAWEDVNATSGLE